jgi:hypothetical protein
LHASAIRAAGASIVIHERMVMTRGPLQHTFHERGDECHGSLDTLIRQTPTRITQASARALCAGDMVRRKKCTDHAFWSARRAQNSERKRRAAWGAAQQRRSARSLERVPISTSIHGRRDTPI